MGHHNGTAVREGAPPVGAEPRRTGAPDRVVVVEAPRPEDQGSPGPPVVPSATVVIPCFNHGRFVSKAVESALAQEEADISVVVVNDGSDDEDTARACDACARHDRARVRVVHQANRGLPAARNAGAAGARSEFLVFLDADDWIEPGFVKTLAAAMPEEVKSESGEGVNGPGSVSPAHPLTRPPAQVSHAYCQERLVEKGRGIWRVPDWDPLLMMLTNIHPVTALVRRERFEAVGGFDETMTGGYEDWDLWLKFVERGWRGVRVPQPLFVWRRHSHSTMIMNVIGDHETLYRRLVAQHADLFARHAVELAVRANVLLRRCDMNWLDETLDPINLRALKRQREMYESMLAVRLHHRIHRVLNALPRPIAGAARGVMGAVKRLGGRR